MDTDYALISWFSSVTASTIRIRSNLRFYLFRPQLPPASAGDFVCLRSPPVSCKNRPLTLVRPLNRFPLQSCSMASSAIEPPIWTLFRLPRCSAHPDDPLARVTQCIICFLAEELKDWILPSASPLIPPPERGPALGRAIALHGGNGFDVCT
jgi:hypothetical protein